MAHSFVSDLTTTSFRINWNFESESNVLGKSISISDVIVKNPNIGPLKYQNGDIPLSGSHLMTQLEPDTEYQIVFGITGNNNGLGYGYEEKNYAKTLPIEQSTEKVTATAQPESSNNAIWTFVIFSVVVVVTIAFVKKKRGAIA